MSFFASVNGLRIVGGQLLIPLVGMWTADLQLASDELLSGSVTVVVGNLTLQGTVYRASYYGGQARCRLVGGAGGWRKPILAQGYGSGSGVKLSHVLGDAAAACGETLGLPNDRTIGPGYARFAGIASDALWQMVGQGMIPAWYIDPSGVTQAQAWPASTVTTPFTATSHEPDSGLVVIATEDYASWMPGCSFSSPLLTGTLTSAGVHYVWGAGGQFRFEVLVGSSDRYLGALESTVQRQIAPTRFFGRYKYTITAATTATVDCAPVDTDAGLPDLQNVRICADSISTYTPPTETECHVEFLGGVPTEPICVWTAGAPTMAQLLTGAIPVALQGSTCTMLWPGSIYVVGTITPPGSVFQGALTITAPAIGQIVTGSSKVSAAQ